MHTYTNALQYAQDQMQQGKINSAQANVLIVKLMGVRVIKSKLTIDVRKALNEAVKAGELGRLKKDGLKPEIYHHKNARSTAIEVQEKAFRDSLDILKKVYK